MSKIIKLKSCRGIIIDKYRTIYTLDFIDRTARALFSDSLIVAQSYSKGVQLFHVINDNVKNNIIEYEIKQFNRESRAAKIGHARIKQEILCPISEDNYIDYDASGDFVKDMVISLDKSYSIAYLNSIGGHGLYKITNDYVILPDLSKYPLTKEDCKVWNSISGVIDKLHFLKKVRFLYFIVDPQAKTFSEYSYKNIIDVNKEYDLLAILASIKDDIYNFVDDVLALGPTMDKKLLLININPNLFFGRFTIVDTYKDYNYVGVVDFYNNLDIDFLMEHLRVDDTIIYYDRFNVGNDDKLTRHYCEDNFLYKLARAHGQIGGAHANVSLRDHFGARDIEIITENHNPPTKYEPCSFVMVVRFDSILFEVTFKSITYEYLTMSGDRTNFKQRFLSRLNSIPDDAKVGYINTKDYNIHEYIFTMPSMFEVTFKKIASHDYNLRMYMIETKEYYYSDVLPKIKRYDLDLSIFLSCLYFRMGSKDKLASALSKVEWFRLITDGRHGTFSDNFMILPKNDPTTFYDNYYVLWYLPRFAITNVNVFYSELRSFVDAIDQLDYIDAAYMLADEISAHITNEAQGEDCTTKLASVIQSIILRSNRISVGALEDIMPKLINKIGCASTKSTEYIYANKDFFIDAFKNKIMMIQLRHLRKQQVNDDFMLTIKRHTNYEVIYQDDTFPHNLKHVSMSQKREIALLIEKFYEGVGYKNFSTNDIFRYPYFCSANYPNMAAYNIFHMHLISSHGSGKKIFPMSFRNFNKIEATLSRQIPWEFLEKYNYDRDTVIWTDMKIAYDKVQKLRRLSGYKYLSDAVANEDNPYIVSKMHQYYDEALHSSLAILKYQNRFYDYYTKHLPDIDNFYKIIDY